MNPRPPLGTKVTFDGVKGRVRGYITARHKGDERSVVVELKRGFFAHTGNHRTETIYSTHNIYLSSIIVHASNLKDEDGNRAWALPEELDSRV